MTTLHYLYTRAYSYILNFMKTLTLKNQVGFLLSGIRYAKINNQVEGGILLKLHKE